MTWEDVRAFRLRRQHLDRRVPRGELVRAVGAIGGAQAQVLPAAQLAVAARVDGVDREDLERAIWETRSLSRAWCMRRTLHLLPTRDLATFVRGSAGRAEKEVRWMLRHGVPTRALERLIAATLASLDEPRTRGELAERVGRALGVPVKWGRGGGWGNARPVPCVPVGPVECPADYLLHLTGARGVICSGPARAGAATYVRADAWAGDFTDLPRERAEEGLLRIYLGAFGPATPEDFARWSGVLLSEAQAVWSRVEGGIEPVDVQGWAAGILLRDARELVRSVRGSPTVRLLPHFDAYLMGHTQNRPPPEAEHRPRVFRDQGWVAPVLTVDGRVVGVWSHQRDRRRLSVSVEPFEPISAEVRAQVLQESERIARFWRLPGAEVRFVGAARTSRRRPAG